MFYGVDLARFFDSNADGYGDFRGLTAKLDYIAWLGFDAIWLQPFYRSPRYDNGYDVIDHYEIDPRLGDTGSFAEFLREAEHRGIRIMIDLVINHSSSDHRWFQESRQPGSARRAWYVWTDDVEDVPHYSPVFPPGQTATWTHDDVAQAWYLHHFHDYEPDLNTCCPDVQVEIRNMVEYWIRLGVRGFRVDGAYYFGQKLQVRPDDAFDVLRDIHEWADDIKEDTVLLPEVDVEGDELEDYADCGYVQMLFNFYLNKRLFLALATGTSEPLKQALETIPEGAPDFCWLNFLRNHDELTLAFLPAEQQQQIYEVFAPDPGMRIYERGIRRRLAPMLDGDRRRMQLAFGLLFALPGLPLIMAGDEIGIGENLDLPDRDAVRLPMQWTADGPNGGFSDGHPGDLVTPVLTDGPFGVERVNVEDERDDPDSFLNWMRRLIVFRKQDRAYINHALPRVLTPTPTTIAFVYAGEDGEASLVMLFNLSDAEVALRCDADALELAERVDYQLDRSTLTLGPYACARWVHQGAVSIEPVEAETAAF